MAALNLSSLGATVYHLAGDERRAEVTMVGGPDKEMLSALGVSLDEADAMFTVFESIADSLGLQYQWQRQGDTVTMVMEQGRT